VQGAFRFARKHQIPLYATEGTFRVARNPLRRKVERLPMRAYRSYKIGRLTVEVFPIPHDAAEPVGFRFLCGKLSFSHVTDIGHLSRPVEELLEGSQVVLIESNHDVDMLRQGPYPESLKHRVGSRYGHLSNQALARYLERHLPETCRHLILAHLSRTNNLESLALSSAQSALKRRGGPVPTIHMSCQDRPSRLLRLNDLRQTIVDEAQGVLAF
jgi:phosphoribosyl 1,2-cyclic phosphodiesterase